MATCTIVVTSNSDGTLTGTTASAPYEKFTSSSLKAVMDWAKGIVFQTLNQGSE
jgi:hypothetical protein